MKNLVYYLNKTHWNYLWIFLFAIGMGFFLIGMPKQVDDYNFMLHLKPWFDLQGVIFPENGGDVFTYGLPVDCISQMLQHGWLHDNIRLSNFIATILLCFPKWVGSGLMLILFMLTVITGFRLAHIDIRHSPLVPLALVMWTFLLPWDDNFGSFDFQINYILPAWIGVTLLWRLRPEAYRSKPDICINMLLALAMGISHEGSGLAFAFGMLLLTLFFKNWRHPDVIIAAFLTISGSIFLLSVPGMVNRGKFMNLDWILQVPYRLRYWFEFFIYEALPFILFLISGVICMVRRPHRLRCHGWLPLFAIISAAISIAIMTTSSAGTRMLFWPNTICIIATLMMLHMSGGRLLHRYTTASAIAAVCLLVPLYANLAFVAYYSVKCRQSMKALLEARIAYPDTYNFGDAYMTGHIPAICGTRPGNCFANTAMLGVEGYYGTWDEEEKRTWFIIPRQLGNVSDGDGRDISFGQGIREIDGYFYMPLDEDLYNRHETDTPWNPVSVKAHVDFGDGPEPWKLRLYKYRSNRDGKMYVWCYVRSNWYTSNFKKIRSITIDEYTDAP